MSNGKPAGHKPQSCPLCGDESIKMFVRPGSTHLCRCGHGHFFLFDVVRGETVPEKRKPNLK